MRSLKAILIVGVLALLASAGFTQEHGGDDALAGAVDALAASYAEAWNGGDAAACAAIYTQDAKIVDLFGVTYDGRSAIQESIEQTLVTYGEGSNIELERTSLRHVNDELVVSDGTWTITGSTAEGVPTEGFYTIVLTRSGGEWLVAQSLVKVAPPMSS